MHSLTNVSPTSSLHFLLQLVSNFQNDEHADLSFAFSAMIDLILASSATCNPPGGIENPAPGNHFHPSRVATNSPTHPIRTGLRQGIASRPTRKSLVFHLFFLVRIKKAYGKPEKTPRLERYR